MLLSLRTLTRTFGEMPLMLAAFSLMLLSSAVIAFVAKEWGLGWFCASVAMMYGVGFPVGNTVVLGTFSKVAEGLSQSMQLSWFGMAGAVSRVVFPILAGTT